MNDNELMHYGVMGMKWGKRRYQNPNGSLTSKGVKKYARKGYAEDSYKSNKTILGKSYDKFTGAHKIGGDIMYGLNSERQNRERAKKYLADKQGSKKVSNRQAFKNAKTAGNEARKASIAESRKTEKGFGSAARASKKAKQAKIEARMDSIKKDKQTNSDSKAKNEKRIARGKKITKALLTAYTMDTFVYGGAGQRAVRSAGRKVTESYLKKRGHTNIQWL